VPTVAVQTIAAPSSSSTSASSPDVYNLVGKGGKSGGPLQQLQFVWAECSSTTMSSVEGSFTASSSAPSWFDLSSCRANPNKCNLSAATGGTCTTGTLPELWAHAAHAFEFCAAAGLGDTIDYLTCVGIQSNASYNASVIDKQAHYSGTIYSECTNMACKRAQPGCVSNTSEGKICWGTVVELDPTYPTPAAAKAYIGYPCLETEPSLVPEVRLQHSLHSALPQSNVHCMPKAPGRRATALHLLE
jgi:hypothetical protein